jgi:hypothetical protein
MGDHSAWLWRVLPALLSFAAKLIDLLTSRPKTPFTKVKKRRFRLRKGELEIGVDWSDRHDQH